MEIQPLSLVGSDQQVDYGGGMIKVSTVPPLPSDAYNDVTVTPIETSDGTARSPHVVRCPGEDPDNPEGCNECRLSGCNQGPPPSTTTMRHVRMQKASVVLDLEASVITFNNSSAGPVLTFPGTLTLTELYARLWARIGGALPDVMFQVYKTATTIENPLGGIYIAIPVPKPPEPQSP